MLRMAVSFIQLQLVDQSQRTVNAKSGFAAIDRRLPSREALTYSATRVYAMQSRSLAHDCSSERSLAQQQRGNQLIVSLGYLLDPMSSELKGAAPDANFFG